jgi:isocitrate/isopropylmalate dehydrogenase
LHKQWTTDKETLAIAALPRGGIGNEVISAGVEVVPAHAQRDGRVAVKVDNIERGGEY